MSKSWDETAAEVIKAYAQRSHCKHFKVAAAFYRGDRLLVVGYNGSPRGEPHCDEIGCAKEVNGQRLPAGSGKCRGAHAEMNALANAAAEGVSLKNSRVYCTFSPCYDCAKVLSNLPITEFLYSFDFPDEDNQARELFARRGIACRKLNEEE